MPHKHTRNGKWTGQWFGQVRKNGIKERKLFRSKAEAKAWEVVQKTGGLVLMPAPEVETRTVTVSLIDWINKYLDYSLRYSPKTYSEKRNIFRRAIRAFGKDVSIASITAGQALDFIQEQFQKRTGHAANKERKNLVAAWNWGVQFIQGFPNVNPFGAVPKFPEECEKRYVPSEKDFRKVAMVAQGQDRVMLIAFLHTAARRGELYRLKWSDVDFANQQVRLTTRKRKDGSLESDMIPMTDELYDALLDHRQAAENEWVFTQEVGRHHGKPYVENRGFPQELCNRAGVKPFGCHAIRHLTASILAKHNVPMVDIQAILRHRKLATTERYVRGLESVRPHLKILEGGYFGGKPNKAQQTMKKGLGATNS